MSVLFCNVHFYLTQLAHKPLFGNDTFKQFMKELIEFVLFDQQLKYKV